MDITREILTACKRDDRKAINTLYACCFKILMPVCFRYNRNEEDARSAFNVGFIKILNGLKNAGEEVNFIPWAKRIMVNSLIDEYRKNKNYNTQITKSDDEGKLAYFAENTENNGESGMRYDDIMRMVKELPESTALVFNLYVIEGYAHKEIAEQLEITEGTSKWHLSVARKLLREKLEVLERINEKWVI